MPRPRATRCSPLLRSRSPATWGLARAVRVHPVERSSAQSRRWPFRCSRQHRRVRPLRRRDAGALDAFCAKDGSASSPSGRRRDPSRHVVSYKNQYSATPNRARPSTRSWLVVKVVFRDTVKNRDVWKEDALTVRTTTIGGGGERARRTETRVGRTFVQKLATRVSRTVRVVTRREARRGPRRVPPRGGGVASRASATLPPSRWLPAGQYLRGRIVAAFRAGAERRSRLPARGRRRARGGQLAERGFDLPLRGVAPNLDSEAASSIVPPKKPSSPGDGERKACGSWSRPRARSRI